MSETDFVQTWKRRKLTDVESKMMADLGCCWWWSGVAGN